MIPYRYPGITRACAAALCTAYCALHLASASPVHAAPRQSGPLSSQSTAAEPKGSVGALSSRHTDSRSFQLNEQGVAAIKLKDFPRAESLFRQALEADAKNVTAAFNLAGMLLTNKRENEAISILERYAKEVPGDAGILVRLGDAYFGIKKPTEALEQYEKALKVAPDYSGLHAKLGALYTMKNRLIDAEKALRSALDREPANGQLASNLSSILLANGKPDRAIEVAKRALQLNASGATYVTIGAAYEALKDPENALIAYQRSLDLGENKPEIKEKVKALEQIVGSKKSGATAPTA